MGNNQSEREYEEIRLKQTISLAEEQLKQAKEAAEKKKSQIIEAKKPANKSQVLFSRFLKLFVNLFLCTIRRPALYPAYTKS